jgi:hypothetical protein
MKLPYREGTRFAVPLRNGGYAIGVVARSTSKGKVVLCYFFGPRRDSIPELNDVESLRSSDAIIVFRVGDLSLVRGDWPIIGTSASWKRQEWPIPPFIRRSELSQNAWRVHYSDSDPNLVVREEPIPYETTNLGIDTMYGAGAAETVLNKLLSNSEH